MKVKGKNVERDEVLMIARMVRRCIRHLRKKEYELDLPDNAADIAISFLEVKRRKDSSSSAGKSLIRINLGYWQIDKPYHDEYKSYNDDPVIGRIRCECHEHHYWVTVAHEVSHHIQRRYGPRIKRFEKTHRKPHGDCFKAIYRYLRRDLINPLIAEQRANARIRKTSKSESFLP